MKLKIEIDLNNAAFDVEASPTARSKEEVMRILQDLNQRLPPELFSGDSWSLFDSNGNKVGVAVVEQ